MNKSYFPSQLFDALDENRDGKVGATEIAKCCSNNKTQDFTSLFTKQQFTGELTFEEWQKTDLSQRLVYPVEVGKKYSTVIADEEESRLIFVANPLVYLVSRIKLLKLKKPKFFCFNDNLDYSDKKHRILREKVNDFLKGYFNQKSSFEM